MAPTAGVPATGLTEAEAARRLEARGPIEPPATSRSTASIVRANVLTVFNLILLGFGILTLAFGQAADALFLGILVANSGIGIYQEVRAKNALDRLAALVAPVATVVRDGKAREVAVDRLVVGDLVRLGAGDQVVADGTVVTSSSLQVDESILTGESRPVSRGPGEEVRSGSFAVEGAGTYDVTAVGDDSYAAKLAGEAREFRHPRSPLERSLDRLLFILVAVMIPLGITLGYALHQRHTSFSEAVTTSVAAVVTMVPEGLILLTSITFAVAAMRMTRRGALTQQLNAVESLAAVDVVCLDKTGTLTEAALEAREVLPAPGTAREELERALGRFAAGAPSPNGTLLALAEAYPAEAEQPELVVPFSSRRRWSGLVLGGTAYVLGAPELFPLGALAAQADAEAGQGRRVLALAEAPALREVEGDEGPPLGTQVLGLVVLAERLRPETRETVRWFLDQGVELRVLSGDRPETVAAIAADAGIPSAGPPLDGRSLPEDAEGLQAALASSSVIGRISPEGKRRVVESLTGAGRYVAMVGDGVNDVPALKACRLAIAQGSGAQIARSVADVVLVRGDFGAIPPMVAEGRKVLRNLQRVTKLFVAKSAFAAFLILSIGLTKTPYPLLPRHLTLAATLTIGIPAFFLALAPSSGEFKSPSFLREVSRFAVPAGTAAGLGVVAAYLFALNVVKLPLVEARTIATTVLVAVGLYLILALEARGAPRRASLVAMLCGALLVLYVVVLALPGMREFFALSGPTDGLFLISFLGTLLAIAGLCFTDDRFIPWDPVPERPA